jgi:hypothetical protein
MKDLRERLHKLRADAADFAVMSRRATLELEQLVKVHSERSGSSDPENVVTLKSRPERD